MSYILKQYDTPLIKFNINKDSFGISTEILWVNEEKRNLLPLSLNKNLDNLSSWLRHRTIPSNRAFVENFLAKLGLNEKDTKGIIDICKAFPPKMWYKFPCNYAYSGYLNRSVCTGCTIWY